MTAALSVTERGDPRIETELIRENVLDVVGLDRVEMLVDGSFGDDDDALSLAETSVLCVVSEFHRTKSRKATHLLEYLAHLALPVVGRRGLLGYEKEISAGRDGGHESEPAAVTAHDFDNESARVRRSGCGDAVNGFADAMESGRSANGQVSSGHVIVDL